MRSPLGRPSTWLIQSEFHRRCDCFSLHLQAEAPGQFQTDAEIWIATLRITGEISINTFTGNSETYRLPQSTLTDNGSVYTYRFTGGRKGFEYVLAGLSDVQHQLQEFQHAYHATIRAIPHTLADTTHYRIRIHRPDSRGKASLRPAGKMRLLGVREENALKRVLLLINDTSPQL